MTLLTVGEAAERLKVSDRYVRRLVERGDVPARRLGESWFIDERALTRRARRASVDELTEKGCTVQVSSE